LTNALQLCHVATSYLLPSSANFLPALSRQPLREEREYEEKEREKERKVKRRRCSGNETKVLVEREREGGRGRGSGRYGRRWERRE